VVGNIFFKSGHNGSANPAVDTVAAGGTVTWTWTNSGSVPHSVESVGSPSFTSSDIKTGDGSTYQATFATPGSYQYECAVHGAMMRGTIVVR
jgi:plastocyanin